MRPFDNKKRSLLKEINSKFTEDNKFGFQVIFDENVVNAFFLDFVLYEQALSLRQLMKLDPTMRPFVEKLNTTNIGLLMHQVLEEFGQDKSVDFHISLS